MSLFISAHVGGITKECVHVHIIFQSLIASDNTWSSQLVIHEYINCTITQYGHGLIKEVHNVMEVPLCIIPIQHKDAVITLSKHAITSQLWIGV